MESNRKDNVSLYLIIVVIIFTYLSIFQRAPTVGCGQSFASLFVGWSLGWMDGAGLNELTLLGPLKQIQPLTKVKFLDPF